MELEEAIDRYRNNAEYERTHGSLQGCMEFEQLAEWLEELKGYRQMIPTYSEVFKEGERL